MKFIFVLMGGFVWGFGFYILLQHPATLLNLAGLPLIFSGASQITWALKG